MPNPPQDVIETTYGALLSAMMVQQFLLGVVCVQIFDYYVSQSARKTELGLNRSIAHIPQGHLVPQVVGWPLSVFQFLDISVPLILRDSDCSQYI